VLVRSLPLFLFLLQNVSAQGCLALSTVTVEPGGTASLDLSLRSGAEMPASLQWTFQFPETISSFSVQDGPATTAAGKAVMCTGNATAYTCLVVGRNSTLLADGVIAKVTAVLAPQATGSAIAMRNSFGASAKGTFISMATGGGIITSARISPNRRLRPPLVRIAGRCLAP
jgi:hypothetical protein